MLLGVLGVFRLTPFFGEHLDFKWGRGATADLSGEELQILLDPAQKAAQICLILHVRCIARRERRTMISKAEDALPLVQECTGQPPLFVEGDAFGGQRDALDEPKPGENSRHMERLQALVHRQRICQASGMCKQSRIADRERDLEQRRGFAKPIGMSAAMREIGPELARKISSGDHAKINLVAEFGKDLRCRTTDSIAARFIDAWPYSDIFFDNSAQPH